MASYTYTRQDYLDACVEADRAHRASPAQLAEAGWYVPRDGSLPVRTGNAAGPGTPEGFSAVSRRPNCSMAVRPHEAPVPGVYRTPEQWQAYAAACKAAAQRYASSRQGRREAALRSVQARARQLGCHSHSRG